MSTAPADPAPMTAEQLLELPDDGMRHELVRGELRTMTPAGYWHGRITLRIGARLEVFVTEHGLGDVLSNDPGFTLERGPDDVRAPAVAFVRAERVPPRGTRGFLEFAPDLVVEVVSPSDRWSDVTEKAFLWLDKGVRLVWVVDPSKRLVVVHRPEGATRVPDDGELDGEDVLPGFRLALVDLFA